MACLLSSCPELEAWDAAWISPFQSVVSASESPSAAVLPPPPADPALVSSLAVVRASCCLPYPEPSAGQSLRAAHRVYCRLSSSVLGTGFSPGFTSPPPFFSDLGPRCSRLHPLVFKDVGSWKRPECGVWSCLLLTSE